MKNKGGLELKNAFEALFKMARPRQPDKMKNYPGKEFLKKDFLKCLKTHGVQHFVSHSEKKATLVERINRTVKTKIWTYFTAKETNVYI